MMFVAMKGTKGLPLASDCQKTRAFTLLELVLSIFIASLVALAFLTLVSFASKSLQKRSRLEDESLNIQYIFSYIENEINRADGFWRIEDMGLYYDNSLGFILSFEEENVTKYVCYFLENKELKRYAQRVRGRGKIKQTAWGSDGGENSLGNVLSIKGTELDIENKLLTLSITLLEDNKENTYSTALYLGIKEGL